MNYWEIRKNVSKIIPRLAKLPGKDSHRMKEKGRKSNYRQFNIVKNEMIKLERLLDSENINSFAEVSLRAQSCPMPLNIDVWDGLVCPFRCKYCFADYFRHSLYTSFFDNGKKIGLRHANLERSIKELGALFSHRGEAVSGENKVLNAVRLGIPIRLGIRFEDFIKQENEKRIAYGILEFLKNEKYPVMINTKSDLPGKDPYVKVLADNEGKSAIHFTLISSDESIIKKIEPGAPSFKERLVAAKRLSEAGVRVVARIEPWMIFLNDEKDKVDDYINQIKSAGITHMTFDSYSYSANSRGLAENFYKLGIDFNRMFLLSSDSQWLSSLLLGKFMEYFRQNGLHVSTFDQGNVPENDDWICCSVGDWFEDAGMNWGSGVIAIKFIKFRKGKPVRWKDFEKFVNRKGGFLSEGLKQQVKELWNGAGNEAWPVYWGKGIEPIGNDEDGTIWRYNPESDFRTDLLNNGGLF